MTAAGPALQQRDHIARVPAVADADEAETAPRTDAVGILIVEDDWFVSMEMEAAVEAAGHRVAGIVASAEEAVAAAAATRPSLVLMDIRLRGARDGVDAAAEIRARFGVRSLFCSAHNDPATIRRAEAADPVGWLPKPYSEHQLAEAIATALARLRGG